MARSWHIGLFHPRLVRARVAGLERGTIDAGRGAEWVARLRGIEEPGPQARGQFLTWLFGQVLGYAPGGESCEWRMEPEPAIGRFERGEVIAAIRWVGAGQSLEPSGFVAPWQVTINAAEIRLYSRSHGLAAYEVFRLESLAEESGLRRLVALLGREALLGGGSRSPLAELLVASERAEREVMAGFYREYSAIRAGLFAELRRTCPEMQVETAVAWAQTIVDRALFVAFAAGRGLIAVKLPAEGEWQQLCATFRAVAPVAEELFADLQAMERLSVSAATCAQLGKLADYDYCEDVSVAVLGHIFEQSIADLEQLRGGETPGARRPSRRQTEGIFYTPSFVTHYLVRATLGRTMQEAWARAGGNNARTKRERVAAWEGYREALRGLRVLDPACGGGAFLIAAFDALAQEFERANRALAELHGGQTSLFDLTRALLHDGLFGIDISAESVAISKLALWLKTAKRDRPLTALGRNLRRGNSVVADPAIDRWAFDWSKGQVGEGPADPRWGERFDVVLGNPPYVRHELLAGYKPHWSRELRTYEGTADLFVYFLERGIDVLRPGGRLGFIVSNKWLRGGYAEKLRAHVSEACTIESIVDFGHAPVFPDADAFPCMITLRKQPPAEDHAVGVTLYPREELGRELLASHIETHRFALPQRSLPRSGWTLEPPGVQALLEKLRRTGVPLGEYADAKPYRGVLTGCNEAFLIDEATKDRLIGEDANSARILRPYLRGQDVNRWTPGWCGQWMIFARRGVAIDDFPAIRRHLEQYRQALEPRPRERSGEWPGRKPGNYAWYELQDSVEYFALFERPKIVYQEIQFHPRYAIDRGGLYVNNKVFVLPSDDPWLVAVLNSPAMWWHNWRHLVHMKDEALSAAGDKMLHVPIPRATAEQAEVASAAVEAIAAGVDEARRLELERTIAEAVHAAYGLDAADLTLMRATAPPRMPPGW